MTSAPDTTQLLLDARAGSRDAFDRLFAHVYDELRRVAHHRLREHRPGDTLATTALVHEAYLRLVDQHRCDLRDRTHFVALASRAMRFVLVDHARAHMALKRGGGAIAIELAPEHGAAPSADAAAMDLLALDDALERLARHSERLARLVEHRFFGGLTFDEIAEATGQSVPTVKRDWARARAWLHHCMRPAAS